MRNFKNYLLICFALCLLSPAKGQYVEWADAVISSTTNQQITDSNGNIYLAGNYGTRPLVLGTTTYTGEGFFIAKYASDGTFIWGTATDNDEGINVWGISVDNDNNIIISGSFVDELTFGTGANAITLTQTPSTAPELNNRYDFFMAKFSPDGLPLWANSGGGSLSDTGGEVVVDSNGDCYFVVRYTGSISFDGLNLTGADANTRYNAILKVSGSTGNAIWNSEASGTSYVAFGSLSTDGTAVYIDYNNHRYVKIAGSDGSIVFDKPGNSNYSPRGLVHDALGNGYAVGAGFQQNPDPQFVTYLTKFSPTGDIVWTQVLNGGDADILSRAITTDGDNVYITGYFGGTFTIGSYTFTSTIVDNMYVAKFNTNGILDWAKAVKSSGNGYPNSISITPQGKVVLAGYGGGVVEVDCERVFSNSDLTIVQFIDASHDANPSIANASFPPEPAGAITGPTAVSTGQQGVNFSVAAITHADSYNWTVPAGALIMAGQGTTNITVNFGTAATGNVTVEGVNGSCVGENTLLGVTVSANLTFELAGNIRTADGQNIEGVEVALASPNQQVTTATDGNYTFSGLASQNYTVTPSKTTVTNGMNVLDLALLQRHVLNQGALDSPYKILAADVDQSGSITANDVATMQRMILGFEASPSQLWYFVPASFVFPNLTNPWSTAYPQSNTYTPLNTNLLNEDFIGIKLGDLNLDSITD